MSEFSAKIVVRERERGEGLGCRKNVVMLWKSARL